MNRTKLSPRKSNIDTNRRSKSKSRSRHNILNQEDYDDYGNEERRWFIYHFFENNRDTLKGIIIGIIISIIIYAIFQYFGSGDKFLEEFNELGIIDSKGDAVILEEEPVEGG